MSSGGYRADFFQQNLFLVPRASSGYESGIALARWGWFAWNLSSLTVTEIFMDSSQNIAIPLLHPSPEDRRDRMTEPKIPPSSPEIFTRRLWSSYESTVSFPVQPRRRLAALSGSFQNPSITLGNPLPRTVRVKEKKKMGLGKIPGCGKQKQGKPCDLAHHFHLTVQGRESQLLLGILCVCVCDGPGTQ